jgi:hypothetical protein
VSGFATVSPATTGLVTRCGLASWPKASAMTANSKCGVYSPVRGRTAIVEFLDGVAAPGAQPAGGVRIVRHNLTNIRFLELTPEHARVASYFTVVTEIGLDHYGRYRDAYIPVGDEWLIKHRLVSTDWLAPNSTMRRPSAG